MIYELYSRLDRQTRTTETSPGLKILKFAIGEKLHVGRSIEETVGSQRSSEIRDLALSLSGCREDDILIVLGNSSPGSAARPRSDEHSDPLIEEKDVKVFTTRSAMTGSDIINS